MIAQNDIDKTSIVCESMNFLIHRDSFKPGMKLDYNIGASWGVNAIKLDNKGIKARVKYIIKSAVLEGEIEATVVVDFIREITKDELFLKENQKIFVLFSVDYVIQWIADVSSKMGIPPFVIPNKLITDLINNAK